jgi:DNA invertase Pin-like site-specific DNA recombinase
MRSALAMSPAKMKIGWALIRVSTKNQAEVQHGSLEQQRHMLERWSAQQSESSGQPYQITRFFEEDISGRGKAIHKRMALIEIERAIELKTIDFIVFEKVDRLARDMIYNLGLVKKAHEYGVEVHEFESGQIDLKDRGSRLGFNIKNLLAEEYSLDLEEKITKKQREARVNNGKDTSTCAVLGLDPHPSKRGMYVINKKEQTILTDIFKKFVECGSVKETSKYCIQKGYRNKVRMTKEKVDKEGTIIPPREVGGEPLVPKRVRYLLTCQKIRGYGFFQDTWNQFKKEQDEKGFVRWNYPHGSVIPPELFEEAQRVLEKNQKFDGRTRGTVYLLTGILEFEDGTKFSGAGAGGRNDHYEYYHCRKKNLRIPKDKIEALILKRIKEYMQNSELLTKLLADVQPMTEIGIPLLKEEVSEIKRKIADNRKVVDGFSNYLRQAALTDPTSLETVIRTIGLERDRAETEIQLMERELANKENQLRELNSDKNGKGIKDYLEQVLENFDSQDDNKKREIIHTIIPRIQVLPKNKLLLHVRTDFRGEGRAWDQGKRHGPDFGHGVSSYQPPVGMEKGEFDSGLGAVTPGGNFSSREQMAGRTGLEPAAFRVTGGRYNQLNYHPAW